MAGSPGTTSPVLWFGTAPPRAVRPPLAGDADVDVAIVGAGYTGLWTAYYLLREQPGMKVLLLEAEHAGFGASGRNGGWCSALFPASAGALARRYGQEQAVAMRRAMNDCVTEVGQVSAAENLDCDYLRGGTVVLARSATQVARAQAEVAADARLGGVDDVQWLDADRAVEMVGATEVLGATYTPHCARIHPAKLAFGLAETVERMGAQIAEGTPVLRITAGSAGRRPSAETAHGRVRASHIIRATEAWSATLPDSARTVAPVYSLMIATQPLPEQFWERAGLAQGQTFADHRHLIIYGQRTADDRLVFGGRGAPYHFGSSIRPAFDQDQRVFAGLYRTLTELFPAVAGYRITHAWGGPLGIPRDWHAGVDLDQRTGLGWAGGYVGDGVGTSNLAGRTLADLTLGRDTALTALPWVGHRSPLWEPEPLRWAGMNAGLATMSWADREEALTGRPSVAARLMGPFLGH